MAGAEDVEAWFDGLDSEISQLARDLRSLLLQTDIHFLESIKWGNPVYEKQGKVCYLAAGKSYISLGFFRGADLRDNKGLVEGTGKKMRHVKIRDLERISTVDLAELISEAVSLDES